MLFPARQQISRSTPVCSSAAVMARAKLLSRRPQTRCHSRPESRRSRRTPSAGDPASTAVIRICRDAAVRSSCRKKTQPRPVGPSSQSWLLSGFPPLVRSGIVCSRSLSGGSGVSELYRRSQRRQRNYSRDKPQPAARLAVLLFVNRKSWQCCLLMAFFLSSASLVASFTFASARPASW